MESNVKKHWTHCTGEKRSLRKRVRGFTLVEIIFALAVLMVGLVGVMALFPVGLEATKRAVDNTVTAMLAQEQMENIRTAGFSYYTPAGGSNSDGWYYASSPPPPGILFDTDRFPGFSYAVSVKAILSNLSRVDMAVYSVDQKAQFNEGGTVVKGYRQYIFTTFLGDTDL